MDKAEFMAVFGGVFEHSAWIADQVWDSGLDACHDSAAGLHSAFADAIHTADQQQKLALLRAHPELGLGMASEADLTASSRAEQRGAGLDRCSSSEYAELKSLNESYRERFGFPFIMAVKGQGRRDIVQAFKSRLTNSRERELQTALEQVLRIGMFRIESKFE
jgi:OHCU decarboxylase